MTTGWRTAPDGESGSALDQSGDRHTGEVTDEVTVMSEEAPQTFLTLLMLGRMFPSPAEGGASKEVGISVDGEMGAGLVGITIGRGGAEPGEGRVKPGGSFLHGLFRGTAVGEPRVRLA